jgi:hypothetical protein
MSRWNVAETYCQTQQWIIYIFWNSPILCDELHLTQCLAAFVVHDTSIILQKRKRLISRHATPVLQAH